MPTERGRSLPEAEPGKYILKKAVEPQVLVSASQEIP